MVQKVIELSSDSEDLYQDLATSLGCTRNEAKDTLMQIMYGGVVYDFTIIIDGRKIGKNVC